MEHMEMIDKLREKAGISREDAADALTRSGWDMLEALVILEQEGKIAPLTSSVVTAEAQGNTGYGYNNVYGAQNRGTGVRGDGEGLAQKIRNLFRSSMTYSLIVRRDGKLLLSLPVLIFVIILLAAFQISAVALLIGLFCGCRFSVEKRGDENGGTE